MSGDAEPAAIERAFSAFHAEFKRIASKSKRKFELRDWRGLQRDAAARLDLYKEAVDGAVATVSAALGDTVHDRATWARIKTDYAARISGRDDMEIAETFFNSITRRLFATVGVDPCVEFVASDAEAAHPEVSPVFRTYPAGPATAEVVRALLEDVRFGVGYEDVGRDSRLVAERIDRHLARLPAGARVDAVEVVRNPFFRNKGAYIVGRMRRGAEYLPLVLPLLATERGVVVDAALLDPDEVSIVFSFTRSYFHVVSERPRELIHFLKSIMPAKRVSELYTSIGYNKHGKTELYRDLLRHLATSDERFEIAPGTKGMVMSVFALPSFDVVFKVIKDVFDYPKTTTRRDVMNRYEFVFKHDRAGRLVDTQEFEHLRFDRSRFSEALLDELGAVAAKTISVTDDAVVVKHLYTERRLVPLNLYLPRAGERATEAVLDYGNAIKDLAAANIFPGDTLLKNFGVTRHGRVVFYDYDEVCLVTECNFRRMPVARNDDDELMAEPWFYVGEHDIFPEEFRTFLGLDGDLRGAFERQHGDLFTTEFWTAMQARVAAGEVADIFPYKPAVRLRGSSG